MLLTEFLSLFKQGKVSAHSHMKNLLEMAMVDGEYDKTEDKLLKQLARKYGISQSKLEEIRKNKENIEFVVPEKSEEKFNQLFDLVNMMVIDEHIAREEMSLCNVFAKKFGFDSNNSAELVDSIASNIRNGQSLKETRTRVQWLL